MLFIALILMLLIVGGLGTLLAIGDPQGAPLAPYIGFTCLFAGLAAPFLSLLLFLIGGYLLESETIGGIGLAVGYTLGGFGGGALGYYCAAERCRRIKAEMLNPEPLD